MIVELVRVPIIAEDYVHRVTHPDCGAVVTFLGVVRDNHRGKSVLRLEYKAYEEMALRQMRQIAAELQERWPIREAAIVHRLGVLEIGEASILIALGLAHRKEGFEALRHAIDTVKEEVPIWKKEYFQDGEAEWVEGS